MKKLNPCAYDTDKGEMPNYISMYENHLSPMADEPVVLLELGVKKGGSLMMWRDYFSKGIILGLDRAEVRIEDPSGRIKTYCGNQDDFNLLDKIVEDNAPQGIDIVIDDCSHIGELTKRSFWHLFKKHLKPGGLYFIEDWGTAYWDSWIDGKNYRCRRKWFKIKYEMYKKKNRYLSHDYGMVGFLKELIDECGMQDITHPLNGLSPQRPSSFELMQISFGIAMIMKSKGKGNLN